MSSISVVILAFGMSIDAMLAALGRGSALRRPGVLESLKTGLIFGVIEAITPVIGWSAGVAASSFITKVDHWIAFGLLSAVGLRMVYHAVSRSSAPATSGAPKASLAALLATAVGTSLDAMAVGVSLAFLDVNIVIVALAIGATTAVMASGGMLAGRLLGERFGRWAEIGGGIALTGIGLTILIEHLSA
jgi:putative Mn2+ efflux pump MntP